MKRYDLEQRGTYDCYGVMEEAPYDGDWVKYEEANAEIDALRASLKQCSELNQRLSDEGAALRARLGEAEANAAALGKVHQRNATLRAEVAAYRARAEEAIRKDDEHIRERNEAWQRETQWRARAEKAEGAHTRVLDAAAKMSIDEYQGRVDIGKLKAALRRLAEWENHYPTDPDRDTDAMRAVARAALGGQA